MPKRKIAETPAKAANLKAVRAMPGEFVVDIGITERLKKKGVTNEEVFRIIAPRRTLDRRKAAGGKLSPVESDRALRLQHISELSERVFGNPEKAQRWLRKPCRALDGAVPIELLVSETGARIIEEELHAIDYGMYV